MPPSITTCATQAQRLELPRHALHDQKASRICSLEKRCGANRIVADHRVKSGCDDIDEPRSARPEVGLE
jgi:hypothetical protein